MGLEQLNLSQIELGGLREYEKSQASSNGRSVFADRTMVKVEPLLKSTGRIYRVNPDSGALSRLPHKHTAAEEKQLEDRRRSKRYLAKTVNRRYGGPVEKVIPITPVWRLRTPSVTDYDMPNPLEDFYARYDMAMAESDGRPAQSVSFGANGNGFLKGSLFDQLLACIQKNPGLCPGWFEETELVDPVAGSLTEEAAKSGIHIVYFSQIKPGLADSAFSITKMPV